MPHTIANANATVDRLLHHAHVVITTGDSIRLTPSNRRQRSETTDQLNSARIHWPTVGNSDGHP